MKTVRFFWLLGLLVNISFISACGVNTPDAFEITVSANYSNIEPTITKGKSEDGSQTVTFYAPVVDGYTFEYWHILDSSDVMSINASFIYAPFADVVVEAVYSITVFTVNVTVNIEDVTIEESDTQTSSGLTQYELFAPEVEGFTFINWIDLSNSNELSAAFIYSFVADKDIDIQAVYTVIAEPTLYYETEFEDASKAAYAFAIITLSGFSWDFTDALIGDLERDLDVSGKSVRIRDGYIQTEFTITDLAQVIFYAGTYGTDSDTTVSFEISIDETTWTVVDSFTTTNSMEEHNYIFDDALFSSLSLSSDSAYYLRIVSNTTARTNVDNLQIYTGEGYIIIEEDDEPQYTIAFTENMVSLYLLDETVDLLDCVATHRVTGDTTCDIIGNVDSSTPGVYIITFYKTDEFDITTSITLNITVIDANPELLLLDLIPYYDNAESLYGEDLINALNIIINTGFDGVTYGEARTILDDSNQDPENPDNLILVYLGTSISGIWDNGDTWNREHVWPQSLLGEGADNNTVNSASDLYNLMPANPSENTSRGNSPYSEITSGYEPRDEVKGDVARALFYMMIMYEELELVNTLPNLHEMGYLDELLSWHYADPVDDFELNRLEVIFSEQLNRNPFVDYPHFVELIWFHEELPVS